MNLKGSLPLLILHILNNGARHGYQLAQEIKQKSAGVLNFKEGTLYPTLHTLEQQGNVETYTEVINGRTRRCYRLTNQGRDTLEAQIHEWRQFTLAVNLVLKDDSAS